MGAFATVIGRRRPKGVDARPRRRRGGAATAQHYLRCLQKENPTVGIVRRYAGLKPSAFDSYNEEIVRVVNSRGQLADRKLELVEAITLRAGTSKESTVVGTWYGIVEEVNADARYFVGRVTPADDREAEALQHFHFKYVAATELDRVREGATFTWTQEQSAHGLLNRLQFDGNRKRRPRDPSKDGKTFAKRAASARMPEIE